MDAVMAESESLILAVRTVPARPVEVPVGYDLRVSARSDVNAVGALYFCAYDDQLSGATLQEATADIAAAFSGEYGELWPEASLLAFAPDSALTGVIQVVRRASWPGTPDCPFVIELFVDRAHRGRGIARALVMTVIETAKESGYPQVALQVRRDNDRALRLYHDLGFTRWQPDR